MPTMDRLAENGLTYTQWHTTALCSPTRSTFLTGRNHHLNGFASISESSTGFPGYNSHIPPSNVTMANLLRDAGWATFWVGKNHNVPIDEWTAGASKKNWPLAQGYDRFYGFIGGETNNWYPSLAEDNRYIEQPYTPEEGYHQSKDLADQALKMIRDVKQTEPEKPAGFSEYTDAQVGRIVDYLEESGQLDNTLIIYCADDGASGEGSPNGSVNEGKIFGGYPDDEAQNLTMVDKLGSPDTYNHYPTGWAAAFSTPYKMFKRYTYQGGVCDPLVIHWPAGMKARGEIRHQYHRSTDIVPTIIEACGVTMPDTYNGVEQTPLSGVSMRYSFDAPAEGSTAKQTQYYEMFGQRGLWHQGWKAVSVHGPVSGMGNFDDDVWELYHADVDRAEAHDLAAQHPEKLEELKALWMEEAKANNVLPLNDLQIIGNPKDFETFIGMEFHQPVPPSGQYVYYPGTSEVPERSAANAHGVSYKILAEVDLTPASQGVIFALGSRFGGHCLFVKDGTVTYAYNFLGIPPEDRISAPVPTSGRHVIGVEFTKEGMGPNREGIGPLRLYIDDKQVGEQKIRTVLGHFSLCGEGLCIGYDGADPVSSAYPEPRFEFRGGEIAKVVFDIADDAYIDVEKHMQAAMARD